MDGPMLASPLGGLPMQFAGDMELCSLLFDNAPWESGSTSLQPEHFQGPQPEQPAAPTLLQGSSSGSSDLAKASARTPAELKKAKHRAKNREAMRRFRQRQKEKSTEEANKQQQQVNELARLREENQMLQARLASTLSRKPPLLLQGPLPVRPSEDPYGQGIVEWNPSKGWDLCCREATLVIKLTPLPGQPPVRLSPRQLQQLTIPQLSALLMAYAACVAPLVEPATADPCGPEMQQLVSYTEDVCGLGCLTAVQNPDLMFACSCNRRPQREVEQQLADMRLTRHQQASLVAINHLVRQQQQELEVEQQQCTQRLQALTQEQCSGNDDVPRPDPAQQREVLLCTQRLAELQDEQLALFRATYAAACCSVFSTLQVAKMFRSSTSWPDLHSMLGVLAQTVPISDVEQQIPTVNERLQEFVAFHLSKFAQHSIHPQTYKELKAPCARAVFLKDSKGMIC